MNISSNDVGRNSCLKSPFTPSILKVPEDSKNLDIPTLWLPIIIKAHHQPQIFFSFFIIQNDPKNGKSDFLS
jgi:hypothetical protein